MRTLLAGLLTFAATALASSAGAEPPPRFEVPRVTEARALPTHEVLLPPDVVARPGETPSEALARALRPEPSERDLPRSARR